MMACRGRVVRQKRNSGTSGFTLIEVLTALAVLAIASGIFATMFIASMNLGHLNQSRTIAMSLAEEQIVYLRTCPEGFLWPDFTMIAPGQFGPVAPIDASDSAQSSTGPPAVMPYAPSAFQREDAFYAQFSAETFARLPDSDAGYVETVTVVRWIEKGKPQHIALTSALPRSVVEGIR